MRCSSSISAVMRPTERRVSPRREKHAARAESAPSPIGRALNLNGLAPGIEIWPVSGEVNSRKASSDAPQRVFATSSVNLRA